jgi:hypothetical protein
MGAPKGMIMARNNVSAGLSLTEQLQEKCRAMVHTLDAWHLTVLHSAASEAKSFYVASLGLAGSSTTRRSMNKKKQSNHNREDLPLSMT